MILKKEEEGQEGESGVIRTRDVGTRIENKPTKKSLEVASQQGDLEGQWHSDTGWFLPR